MHEEMQNAVYVWDVINYKKDYWAKLVCRKTKAGQDLEVLMFTSECLDFILRSGENHMRFL